MTPTTNPTPQDKGGEGARTRVRCPKCGENNCCLVGDGYEETYLCMVCHFDAGRHLQNTPEQSGTAREAPSTNRDGTTVGPQAAAQLILTKENARLAERVRVLEGALKKIADHMTLRELSENGEDCQGGFEGAYDALISVARDVQEGAK